MAQRVPIFISGHRKDRYELLSSNFCLSKDRQKAMYADKMWSLPIDTWQICAFVHIGQAAVTVTGRSRPVPVIFVHIFTCCQYSENNPIYPP